MHTIFGLFTLINFPSEVQTKLLGFTILFLGFWGMWRLLDKFNINDFGKSIGSIFFLLNSFFLLLFDGGQLSLALAYCTLPTVIFYFLKAIETNSLTDTLKLTLWILILSIFDIRIIYLVFLIIFVFFVFKIFTSSFKNSIFLFKKLFLSAIITGIILVSFHMYWLLPIFISKPIQLPQTYDRASQVDFLSFSSIVHSLLLQQPHWYKNIFGQVSLPQAEFVFIPILVFLAPLLKRKDRAVGFWLVIALVGIFLSKGSNEPLPQVYSWLFTHIPGFSLFRDPVKFYFITSLAFTILISITVARVSSIRSRNYLLNKLVHVFPLLVVIYFIWLIRPVYLGQMTGMFSFPIYQKEYSQLADTLRADKEFSRVFWIPTQAPLGYTDSIHPSVEASRFAQKRPFAVGIKGSYETFNFLREAPYMGEIFDVAGIGYIADPYLDPRRDNMHPDNIRYYYLFLDQLSKLPWLSKVDNAAIPLLRTEHHQDKFFVASNVWWVIGSDNIYNDATKSSQLHLSKNALIFAEEYSGLGERIDELQQAKIVLNNKTFTDLAATFIKKDALIFPAKQLNFDPDPESIGTNIKSGWWKREAADLIRWREFLQIKYGIDNQDFDLGGGWAVGEGNRQLKIDNGRRRTIAALATARKLKIGNVLLARVLESTRSGQLSFFQDDKLVGQVDTKKPGNNIRWFEVGQLPKDGGELEIKSFGDINVVNTLAVLDKNEWVSYQDKAKQLQGRIVSFGEKSAQNDNNPTVNFKKINPTKYIVTVNNLTKASFLVFSQNYDRLWKIDNQPAFPVYSLLDGFRIDGDGQYIVEFAAQKYVLLGLIISGFTLLILTFLLFKRTDL